MSTSQGAAIVKEAALSLAFLLICALRFIVTSTCGYLATPTFYCTTSLLTFH